MRTLAGVDIHILKHPPPVPNHSFGRKALLTELACFLVWLMSFSVFLLLWQVSIRRSKRRAHAGEFDDTCTAHPAQHALLTLAPGREPQALAAAAAGHLHRQGHGALTNAARGGSPVCPTKARHDSRRATRPPGRRRGGVPDGDGAVSAGGVVHAQRLLWWVWETRVEVGECAHKALTTPSKRDTQAHNTRVPHASAVAGWFDVWNTVDLLTYVLQVRARLGKRVCACIACAASILKASADLAHNHNFARSPSAACTWAASPYPATCSPASWPRRRCARQCEGCP